MSNNKPEVVFAEGCFDHLDLSQEEIDELKAQIIEQCQSGDVWDTAQPLSEEEEEEILAMIELQKLNIRQ
jgi:hypothetical protein